MKNVIFRSLFSIIALVLSLNGFASGLVPEQCTIKNCSVYYPIESVKFTFDGAVTVADNSIAMVCSDGKTIETGVLSCSNYTGEKRTVGFVIVTFKSPLLLPKGKTYRLIVPAGVITRDGDTGISNEEISEEFSVPETLGVANPTIEDGSVIEKTDRIGFYFRYETEPVGNPKIKLLREGVTVREYDCEVSWDWNKGYAGIYFGGMIKFEEGVRYSVQLPEGSISSLYRSDIVNEWAEVSFVGGSTDPIKPVKYVWCSLYDSQPAEVLGEVKFFYDQPVSLTENPVVQLYNDKKGLIVKEIYPVLAEGNGRYELTADFGNVPLAVESEYSIIIPEGTLVTKSGDISVNQRNVIPVGKTDYVAGVDAMGITIKVDGGSVQIGQAAKGSNIKLLSLDGEILNVAKVYSENVYIPVPKSGTYLLVINSKTYKIIVE